MTEPTHACPGRCGRQVEHAKFACALCWYRLPSPMRAAINRAYRRNMRAHAAAMDTARTWYANNPPDGTS